MHHLLLIPFAGPLAALVAIAGAAADSAVTAWDHAAGLAPTEFCEIVPQSDRSPAPAAADALTPCQQWVARALAGRHAAVPSAAPSHEHHTED